MRYIVCFLIFGFISSLSAHTPTLCAIVADMKTGKVFYEKNSGVRVQPASLTKMMTLLLTFKALRQNKIKPNTMITFSRKAANQRPSRLGERIGKNISVHNAILALITKSANDVAVALAEHLGGSEANFVEMMNKEAKFLKMHSTNFRNASGLADSRQLTTVKDMLLLSKTLITKYSCYYHLFGTKKFFYKNRCLYNHNKLLGKKKGMVIDGIKTGFVNASGFNLAASAKKGNQRLIVVVLGGQSSRYRDIYVTKLLEKGFKNQFRQRTMFLAKIDADKKNYMRAKASCLQNNSDENKVGIYNKLTVDEKN